MHHTTADNRTADDKRLIAARTNQSAVQRLNYPIRLVYALVAAVALHLLARLYRLRQRQDRQLQHNNLQPYSRIQRQTVASNVHNYRTGNAAVIISNTLYGIV